MTHGLVLRATPFNICPAIRSIRPCSTIFTSTSACRRLHQPCLSRPAAAAAATTTTTSTFTARTNGPPISAGISSPRLFHATTPNRFAATAKMGKPKALLLGEIDHAKATWEALSDVAELVRPTAKNRAEFIEECKAGKLDGVVAAYRTFGSIAITGLVDEELVNALPASLKFIAHNGAGYDQVDVYACKARGIQVSNVPSIPDDATADVNIFLILGALRGFNTSMMALRAGQWRGNPPPPLGHDPEGKVLGILGMGGIGRNLKRKVEVFGMKVIYHNRRKLSEEQSGGAEYVSFDDLLARSDVLSLNLPLNKNTRHIISGPQFAKMKRGVVIVNTARGAVMDEDALVKALESGQVASAGLDVYEEEPKVHPGLVANPHVMLVPHMGTWTVETQTKMEEWTIGNVRAALEKGRVNSIVPEQEDMQ